MVWLGLFCQRSKAAASKSANESLRQYCAVLRLLPSGRVTHARGIWKEIQASESYCSFFAVPVPSIVA